MGHVTGSFIFDIVICITVGAPFGLKCLGGDLGTEYRRFPYLEPRSPWGLVGHMIGSLIFISLIDKTIGGPFHRHLDGEDWALNTGDALIQCQGLPGYLWVT